jgi:hypothetical protein
MRIVACETPAGLQIIDGDAKADTASTEIVRVPIVDVNESEADKVLATLDPLAGLTCSRSASQVLERFAGARFAVRDGIRGAVKI